MQRLGLTITLAAFAVAVYFAPARAAAQAELFDRLDLGSASQAQADPVKVRALFTAEPDGRTGTLYVTAEMDEGWHIYSITQPPGGPIRSNLKLAKSDQYKLAGDFRPDPAPRKHVDERAFPGLTLEEHEDKVTWSAPIRFTSSDEVKSLEIGGKAYVQACNAENCNPPKDYPFTAKFAKEKPRPAAQTKPSATDEQDPAAGEFRGQDVKFRGSLSPKVATPGGKVRLTITAEPAEGWHIYALSDKPTQSGSKPTLLVMTKTSGLKPGPAVASEPPTQDPQNSIGEHDGKVTWTIELSVPRDAKSGPIGIEGLLGYQVCLGAERCNQPTGLEFAGTLAIGPNQVNGNVPLKLTGPRKYREVQDLVDEPGQSTGASSPNSRGGGDGGAGLLSGDDFQPVDVVGQSNSLFFWIATGCLAGLILNVMPCVLPVIGLKLLSFVEQSGHHRGQAFLLNAWYSLGIVAVFMVLATLPVVARVWFNTQFAWGQQFAYEPFRISLTAIVFVMALSFLGVWEIPIPGFVGGSKAGDLAAKEGFAGAFFKGVITTVLATPCGGPMLVPVLGYAVTQPVVITYVMFASIGLGMASPYLLIGAFPQLIRFLPKPGDWMDTFKELMGFVLLGTVVFLLSFIHWPMMVPTFALLVSLWGGCWWIGRTPLYAEFPAKARAWSMAVIFASLMGVLAFRVIGPEMEDQFRRDAWSLAKSDSGTVGRDAESIAHASGDRLPWRQFSRSELDRLTAEGKTVMIDFTAKWCAVCKALEATVLNTHDTKELVSKNGIIPMIADMSDWPDEEGELLTKLTRRGTSIPVLAIFPAGRPNRPIVLSGFYTQATLFEKLKEAGASRDVEPSGELTAMSQP